MMNIVSEAVSPIIFAQLDSNPRHSKGHRTRCPVPPLGQSGMFDVRALVRTILTVHALISVSNPMNTVS